MLSGLSGIGALAGLTSKYQPTKDGRRVVAAFVKGKAATGACQVPRSKGCNYESTGFSLKVKGATVARRVGGNSDTVEVCVDPRKVEEKKAGNAFLRLVKAGISVREGSISGRKGRHKAAWPGCVKVQLTKPMVAAATAELVQSAKALVPPEPAKAPKRSRKARKAGRKAAKARRGGRQVHGLFHGLV